LKNSVIFFDESLPQAAFSVTAKTVRERSKTVRKGHSWR